MRGHIANAKRVTIGCGARGAAYGDAAVRPSNVFNNDALAN